MYTMSVSRYVVVNAQCRKRVDTDLAPIRCKHIHFGSNDIRTSLCSLFAVVLAMVVLAVIYLGHLKNYIRSVMVQDKIPGGKQRANDLNGWLNNKHMFIPEKTSFGYRARLPLPSPTVGPLLWKPVNNRAT